MNPFHLMTQLGAWGQAHSLEVLGAMVAVPVLAGSAGLLLRRRRGETTTHGSARWATPREVRQAGLMGRHGVVVGRLGGRVLLDDSEKHILLVAPTGAGKGVGVIIPTLLTWGESALILDPKDGENMDVTAAWRGTFGRVEAFTPCRTPQTCINVCDTIRFGKPQEFGDAYMIGQSLTAAEKQARETDVSRHFRELATFLLTASQLHVGYTTGRASLARTWDFLTQHQDLTACLQTMRSTAHTSHGVHRAVAHLTTAIKNISGEKELGSVWSTAIRPLVLYEDPYVAASTDTSTINLDDLQYGPVPMSLYMVAPSPRALERLHPLYRVVLDVSMARLMEHKVRTWKHRLLLCADELPVHGYSHTIDKGAADMRGYGMKGLFVTQDIKQLDEVFGEQSRIWGNTGIKIFHTADNDYTAKRISENFMGKGTLEHPVESRQGGILGRRSVSMQHVARALLTTDEVMELDSRRQIVRMSGVKPILCNKVNYRTDKEWKERWGA